MKATTSYNTCSRIGLRPSVRPKSEVKSDKHFSGREANSGGHTCEANCASAAGHSVALNLSASLTHEC